MSWLAACLWPPDVSKDYSRKDDWGISWLEMFFSFILFSNMYPPVKTGGQKTDAIFLDYNAHEALLLPMAYVDLCCFQDLLYVPTGNFGHRNHHLGGHHSSVLKKCSSLRHFSFSGTFAGLPCRPCLPNPSETCQAVFSYISRLGGADSFYLPLNLLSAPVPFNVGPLQELPIAQRHQVWQRIVTRRYKQKNPWPSEQQPCH